MYIKSEYICGALKALGYLTYKVTMPFLNCVERCDQNSLLPIIKSPHNDLQNGKFDILTDYHVPWAHIKTEILQPTTTFDHLVLDKMCKAAADGIYMQCAGEYWEDVENSRATQVHKLKHDERKNLPTENLACERYLSQFGALAGVSAAKSNKFFKAKRIRDDLMFNKEMSDGEEEIVKATNNILNHLKSVEISWTADQRRCWKEKIEESVKKNTRKGKYKDLLLNQCKRHGGPFTSTSEIRDLVKETHDQKILKS